MSNMVFGKYRVVSKFRFTLFISIVTIIICMCLSYINGSAYVSGSSMEVYETVTVKPGDTLWDIAAEHVQPNTDIRTFVHELEELNSIDGGCLIAGQEIIIPV